MPIYEYKCPDCGEECEIRTPYRDLEVECNCGTQMEKETSLTAPAQFKGNGWTGKHYGGTD